MLHYIPMKPVRYTCHIYHISISYIMIYNDILMICVSVNGIAITGNDLIMVVMVMVVMVITHV